MEQKKYKVLYVDDEEINLRLFIASYRRDFEIITCDSAKEALKILETEKVDVVLTDQRMPEMTGVELLAEIDKKFPDIPPNRLMVSGYSRNEDIEKAFNEYKLYKFIRKPWSYEMLRSIIFKSIETKNE